MEHQTVSATVPQSDMNSDQDTYQKDRELIAAWNRAKSRVADSDVPELEKVDFSKAIHPRNGISPPQEYDPWEHEKLKAASFNAKSLPPDDTGWDCPICKNRGTIYEIARLEDCSPHHIIRTCKCVETRMTIRRMQQSGLEKIISDNLFPKFEDVEPWQKTIKSAAEAYAKDPDGWFYIGGQSGCGKTHLCTAICREALLKGHRVVYMMWRDDAPRLKAAVNNEDYPAMVDRYKKAQVLYIDDLFKTGRIGDAKVLPTSADINLAYEIINYRCVSKLTTIITSEFLLREMVDIDEALTGRIAQMAGTNAFNINLDRSKNYRLRGMVEL